MTGIGIMKLIHLVKTVRLLIPAKLYGGVVDVLSRNNINVTKLLE
jgi:hypothetical protein